MKKSGFANKKGLSDVVTTVLIILLALVAVAIIGGVVIKNINKSAGKFDALSSCQELQITPIRCNITSVAGYTSPFNVAGVVTVSRGSDSAPLSKITLLYEDGSGVVTPVATTTGSTLPAAYESKNLAPVTAQGSSTKAVKIAAYVKGSDGTDIACNPVDVKVSCT